MYPVQPGILQATAYFAQAAKEAAVSAIVNMWVFSARREAKSHAAQDHWISEQVLNWSGVPTTHLRPTLFAEWALYWTGQIKTAFSGFPLERAGMRQSRRRIKLESSPRSCWIQASMRAKCIRCTGRKNILLPRLRPR